ncbi:hypothetical protein [Streptomyces sp. DW26H14]|uniref:hypothetical protein n=1 Tax=Streptomyces sp. DW26H14 TaxID=3435395 RepID=UPI00403E17B2
MSDDSPLLPPPAEMSHAVLLALLMRSGGSATLPAAALTGSELTGPDGNYHALRLEALDDDMLRVSVQPRPDAPGAYIGVSPAPRCTRCDGPSTAADPLVIDDSGARVHRSHLHGA